MFFYSIGYGLFSLKLSKWKIRLAYFLISPVATVG
jgi:hypothetical protein